MKKQDRVTKVKKEEEFQKEVQPKATQMEKRVSEMDRKLNDLATVCTAKLQKRSRKAEKKLPCQGNSVQNCFNFKSIISFGQPTNPQDNQYLDLVKLPPVSRWVAFENITNAR